jgi:hypothetical protein
MEYRVLRTATLSLLACLVAAQTALAQTDPWDRVQTIERGRTIEVKLCAPSSFRGKMEAWRPDGLTVVRGSKVYSYEKSEIAQVALVIGKSRAKKALIAGLVTGGAVAGVLGAVAAKEDCCYDVPAGAIVGVTAVVWGGAAAGIAALFPPHREVIYRK